VPAPDTPRPAPPARLHKGQQTRAAILDAALALASHMGLEGLSIGALAEVTQMSKSGVFAHFGSREELQISVIREYHARFEEEVFFPAMREPRGLPRLRALFERWVRRVSVELDSGCIYISGAVEFDDRPGPVRDALVVDGAGLALGARARDPPGHRRRPPARRHRRAQMLFEMHGLILALHHDARFLRNPALDRARTGFDRVLVTTRPASDGRSRSARAPRPIPASFSRSIRSSMPQYTPPLRDMQFVLHELLERHRRAEACCPSTPTSTPTRSTRCSKRAASSPPR
jgi:AcrR family transcriptional regulator